MADRGKPVWFITGCSTDFGRQIAHEVLGRGWQAVVTARDPSTLADLVAESPENALAVPLDVTEHDQVRAAVLEAEARFGGIDVLVNNAGHFYGAPIEEGEDAEVREMFNVNVFALADVIRTVLPGMRRARRGHIVNIVSVRGLNSVPGSGYYAATKLAVEALSEALGKEVAPFGIKVLAVEPSVFHADFTEKPTDRRLRTDRRAPQATQKMT
jgi:NADP-dependent 3-hydroxy acid dehydrogenase YdfG